MNRIRRFLAAFVVFAFSPCFLIFSVAEDRVITSAELQQVSQHSFWSALSVLEPSFVLTDRAYHGDVPGYIPDESAVRGFSRWASRAASRNILFLIDGNRVPLNVARALNVSDIREIRVITDAVNLAACGIHGADGVVEIQTVRPTAVPLQVSYRAGFTLLSADKSPYAAQQKNVAGPTNWLSEPLQTGFTQRHQIDVGGSDRQVSYRFTATFSPAGRGVMKGLGNNDLSLRSYVGYRHKAIDVYNDMGFDYYNARKSNFGRWGDMALIQGTESPYDAQGALQPFVNVNGRPLPNPLYEHSLGSFFKERTVTLTDRLGVRAVLPWQLQLNGNFSYVRQFVRYDDFISPSSAVFLANTDLRANGTYHIRRSGYTSYEGGASLSHHANIGKGVLSSALGFSLFDGHSTGESYGGRGILNDRLAYITFTQGYDTLQAPSAHRFFERTMRVFANVDYMFRHRYGIKLSGNLNRSNLLAPEKRSRFYWAGKLYWNMHNEPWLENSRVKTLRLFIESGTTGVVPFSYSDFTNTYTNNINDEYIYNYYQIGSRLSAKPNTRLKPVTMLMWAAGADMTTETGHFHAEFYRNSARNQLVVTPLPAIDGFYTQAANGGKVINTGFELTASDRLFTYKNVSVDGWMAMRYNHNGMADIPAYFNENVLNKQPLMLYGMGQSTFRGSIGWLMAWKKWGLGGSFTGVTGNKVVDYLTATHALHSDNRLQWSSLWLGRTLKFKSKYVDNIQWMLQGSNLLTWRSARVPEGICYPLTRSFTLSASIMF